MSTLQRLGWFSESKKRFGKDFDWRYVPPFLLFMLSHSNAAIGYAIHRYRETERDDWRMIAVIMIDYARWNDSGTCWGRSDLTL